VARKLITVGVFVVFCAQAFGVAALCKMQCCPEARVVSAPAPAAGMPAMTMHQHRHGGVTTSTANHACQVASGCSAKINAQQPQIVQETGTKPGVPQLLLALSCFAPQRREIRSSLPSFAVGSPPARLAAPLRI